MPSSPSSRRSRRGPRPSPAPPPGAAWLPARRNHPTETAPTVVQQDRAPQGLPTSGRRWPHPPAALPTGDRQPCRLLQISSRVPPFLHPRGDLRLVAAVGGLVEAQLLDLV